MMTHSSRKKTGIKYLPTYLKYENYSERHYQYSERRLSLEIFQRQNLYANIQSFKQYLNEPETFFRNYLPGIRINQYTEKYIKNHLNGNSNLTIKQYNEIEAEFYLDEIKRLSLEFTNKNLSDEVLEKKLIEKESWDSRPYITPARFSNAESQSLFDPTYSLKREPFKAKEEKIIEILIDLDFAPSVIKKSVEKLAKYEQSRIGYKHQLSQAKNLFVKIKQYKIIQLMDIFLWLEFNPKFVTHEELELFLYPLGYFTNNKFSEEVISMMKTLFDQKSKRSKFLFYLADTAYQNSTDSIRENFD